MTCLKAHFKQHWWVMQETIPICPNCSISHICPRRFVNNNKFCPIYPKHILICQKILSEKYLSGRYFVTSPDDLTETNFVRKMICPKNILSDNLPHPNHRIHSSRSEDCSPSPHLHFRTFAEIFRPFELPPRVSGPKPSS